MPQRVTCPNCQRVLNLPDGCEGATLICPVCSTKVAHSTPTGIIPGPSSSFQEDITPKAFRPPPRDVSPEGGKPPRRRIGLGTTILALLGVFGLCWYVYVAVLLRFQAGWLLEALLNSSLIVIAAGICVAFSLDRGPSGRRVGFGEAFVYFLAFCGVLAGFCLAVWLIVLAVCWSGRR